MRASRPTSGSVRIVASMIKEAAHPNSALKLSWIPTLTMVADALTKTMEAGVLPSFFGARKRAYGARQPRAAMLASVLLLSLIHISEPTRPEPI
eukprot:3735720-Pyramimonas_sp.AAC.1